MRTFAEWWAWGLEQADAARREPPLQINDDDLPAEWEQSERRPGEARGRRPDIIGGLPFTKRFEDYVLGEPVGSPLRDALSRLYNPRIAKGGHYWTQTHEYRILFALLGGHRDPETVRALIGGCRRDFFEAAAIRALVYLDGRINSSLPAPEPLTRRDAFVRSSQQKTRRDRSTSPAVAPGQRSYRHAHK